VVYYPNVVYYTTKLRLCQRLTLSKIREAQNWFQIRHLTSVTEYFSKARFDGEGETMPFLSCFLDFSAQMCPVKSIFMPSIHRQYRIRIIETP
jgi:hypothetical protein